jgi:hypothetical protein
MDLWGQPLGEPSEAFIEASSSIAPSTASPTPPISPKKEETKLDLAQMLRELTAPYENKYLFVKTLYLNRLK